MTHFFWNDVYFLINFKIKRIKNCVEFCLVISKSSNSLQTLISLIMQLSYTHTFEKCSRVTNLILFSCTITLSLTSCDFSLKLKLAIKYIAFHNLQNSYLHYFQFIKRWCDLSLTKFNDTCDHNYIEKYTVSK